MPWGRIALGGGIISLAAWWAYLAGESRAPWLMAVGLCAGLAAILALEVHITLGINKRISGKDHE